MLVNHYWRRDTFFTEGILWKLTSVEEDWDERLIQPIAEQLTIIYFRFKTYRQRRGKEKICCNIMSRNTVLVSFARCYVTIETRVQYSHSWKGVRISSEKTNFERRYIKNETTRELFVVYKCFIFRKTFNLENRKMGRKKKFSAPFDFFFAHIWNLGPVFYQWTQNYSMTSEITQYFIILIWTRRGRPS